MQPSSSLPHSDLPCGPAVPPCADSISAHRVAMVRRRIAAQRYPINTMALAAEVLACLPQRDGGSAISSVTALLVKAISRLDRHAALILQLEFVERLTQSEIAIIVEKDPHNLAMMRGAALLTVKALLDAP